MKQESLACPGFLVFVTIERYYKNSNQLVYTTDYTYNSYGQCTSATTYTDVSTSINDVVTEMHIATKYTYETTAGSKIFGALLSEEDSLGNSTVYVYDEKSGRPLATVNGVTCEGTAYTYDSMGRITSAKPLTNYSHTTGNYTILTNAESVVYNCVGVDAVKVSASLGYTGFSAGIYLGEIFGSNTAINFLGLSAGIGYVISVEVIEGE